MTEPLKPSNDLETALWAAVERGDVEAYLHMLRDATVVVPKEGDSGDSVTLPLLEVDGQPHLPVFTSPDALLAVPRWRNHSHSSVALSELARMWPDPGVRLAVNPGLPSAVYVPGTYARSTGVRLGAVDPRTVLELPDIQQDGFGEIRMGTFETHNQVERDLVHALVGADPEAALRALLSSSLFIVSTEKDGYTLPGQPGFTWITVSMRDTSAFPVFTSRERIKESMGVGSMTYSHLPVSLADLPDAWPDHDLALVVNPGTPLSVWLPGPGVLGVEELVDQLGLRGHDSDFNPGAAPDDSKLEAAALALALYYQPGATLDHADDLDEALLEAASKGDRAELLRLLLNTRDGLRLSVDPDNDPGQRYAGQDMPWLIRPMGDRRVLAAYTSPHRQREVTGARGSRSSGFLSELLRHWPDPSWDLAINPGTPIGAVLPADQIVPLSEWYDQAVAHNVAHHFPARTDKIDHQLFDAARRGNRTGFLEILRSSRVWITSPNRELKFDTPPTDPVFPWTVVSVRGRPSIVVYTSTWWRSATGGSGGTIRPMFGELAAAWPDSNPDLVLNPASPISITLTADEIRAYAVGG